MRRVARRRQASTKAAKLAVKGSTGSTPLVDSPIVQPPPPLWAVSEPDGLGLGLGEGEGLGEGLGLGLGLGAGVVFATVTVTGDEVVVLPAASRATAVSACAPLAAVVVFQVVA